VRLIYRLSQALLERNSTKIINAGGANKRILKAQDFRELLGCEWIAPLHLMHMPGDLMVPTNTSLHAYIRNRTDVTTPSHHLCPFSHRLCS
jgi:hypothetical protein